ncbi:MAG: hypothetical protein AMS21_06505 [Gemmatimonas sp. SG8_38_2]|nr:MAG: hypothetical protein AMS21_06505 [Gemmatimonas sp. SG8_38_2]
MGDLKNLQSRLAREEATLSATHEQIEAGHRKVEAFQRQIEDVERQIGETEAHIKKLEDHTKAVEKRMALLREYVEMVEAGEDPLEPIATGEPDLADDDAPGTDLPTIDDEEEEIVDLDFVQPMTGPAETSSTTVGPISFDDLDVELLSHEILPHTHTFGEELLLVLAYHRKPVASKDVARVFRRLDYAPKLSPTAKNVRAQVETDPHLFESAAGDKISLTREGRDEARQLLQRVRQEG